MDDLITRLFESMTTIDVEGVLLNVLEAIVPKEPVQEPANNEVEKTKDKQLSAKEIRLTAECEEVIRRSTLFKIRGARERRLGLLQSYPIIWIGDLFISKSRVRVAIKFIYGDIAVFKDAVPPCTVAYPGIKLTNRMKFGDLPKKEVIERIQAEEGSCVVIAVPLDLHVEQCMYMEKVFIDYFEKYRLVGVSHFPEDGIREKNPESESGSSTIHKKLNQYQFKYEVMIFPPSEFVHLNLAPIAPRLAGRLYKDNCPHLMLLISDNHLAKNYTSISPGKQL